MSKFEEANEKITEGYKKIEEAVVDGYKKVEETVVDGYKKIEDKFSDTFLGEDSSLKTNGVAEKVTSAYKKVEDSVVGGFNKIADKFVDTFLTRDGESTEDARERIAQAQREREEKHSADMEARAAKQQAMIDASLEASRNAGKHD